MSLILALLGCGGEEPRVPGELLSEGQRVQVAEVTFNLWTDYIPMLGALDSSCRWVDPAITDDTTPWPPLQAFWLIYDDEDEVTQATIPDTYFEGDGLLPADFPPRQGLEVLGFKPFSGFQQNLLDVQDLRITDEGRTLEADFGSPISATIRLVATDETPCVVATTVCQEGCVDFEPLQRIHLDLGTFFTVQDVRFE